ncbi:MAG TPA: M48 family metallopeptidase [Thermodesulfobacteriota bacterium]
MKTARKKLLFALLCAIFAASSMLPSKASAEAPAGHKARVKSVFSKLESVLGWTPKVVFEDTDRMSAFVMPDGTVVVSAGLLSIAESDDELAFILAHEASHIIANDQTPGTAGLSGLDSSGASEFREERADRMAVGIMEKAGFDRGASIRVLKKLSGKGTDLNPRILALSKLLYAK